jgi:hypothetical protein
MRTMTRVQTPISRRAFKCPVSRLSVRGPIVIRWFIRRKTGWLPTIVFARRLSAFHCVLAPSVLNRVKSYSGGAIFSKSNKCAPPCSSSPIRAYPSFCNFPVSFCPVETLNVSFTACCKPGLRFHSIAHAEQRALPCRGRDGHW